jgi:hypothetical protein
MKKLIIGTLLVSLASSLFALPNLLEKKEVEEASIKNLVFGLSWENLEIQETYGNTIDIEIYSNNRKASPRVKTSGSTLYIDSVSSFTFGTRCTVIVYIPQHKKFNEIELKASSGEINVTTLLSAQKIYITTSSGEITSEQGLYADTIKLRASSGDIEANNLDANDFTAETSSGEILIKQYTGSTGTLTATSGEIEVNGFAAEYTSFKTTSGEIEVKQLDCDYFDAKSTSGEIYLELINAPHAKSSATSTSGSINIVLPKEASFEVASHSNSGTLKNKFTSNKFVPRDTYYEKINGGGPLLELSTTSGSIEVEY